MALGLAVDATRGRLRRCWGKYDSGMELGGEAGGGRSLHQHEDVRDAVAVRREMDWNPGLGRGSDYGQCRGFCAGSWFMR